MDQRFVIEWSTTATTQHRAVVSAARMATMLGVSSAEVRACNDLDELRGLGDRGLENGLADIESDETETDYDGPYRDNIEVRAWTSTDSIETV